MRWMKSSALGVLVTGMMLVAAIPATAQDCRIKRFGGPNRFSDPVDSVAALQAMFTGHWSEIAQQLREVGWPGNPDDLAAAVKAGKVNSQNFPAKTSFDWMLLRRNGQPTNIRNQCWAGPQSFSGWAIDVDSRGRRWHFIVPKACGNVALSGSDALPSAPGESRISPQQPPPPAPAPPPRPAAPAPPVPPPPPRVAPPPPGAAPTAPTSPIAMVDEGCGWATRFFGAWTFSDDDFFESANAGTVLANSTGGNVSDGWGAGIEAECRLRSRIGIPLALLYLENEIFLQHDTRTAWYMDHGDVKTKALTLGLNWHFAERDSRVDGWIGPFIGIADIGDSDLDLQGFGATIDDTPFIWGATLGIDVPAGHGWGFHAGARYLDLSTDVEGTGLDLDLDPILITAGVAYHF